ncbi:MAG: hypothetical protein ACLRMZ_13625 [Blautia marasmi]
MAPGVNGRRQPDRGGSVKVWNRAAGEYAKRRVSIENEIHNRAASSTLAPLDQGMVDVTICLNGQEVTEESSQVDEFGQVQTAIDTYWEYDFHQFREKAENINRETVEVNPEHYLGYVPYQPKNLEGR